ncbi:MAG: hypothetical protein AB1758_02205 [Candidatus Eremiobacterota bacterium]
MEKKPYEPPEVFLFEVPGDLTPEEWEGRFLSQDKPFAEPR